MVAEVLKMFQLLDKYRVAEVQVRRGRVKAGLYAKRLSLFPAVNELFQKLLFGDDGRRAAFHYFKLFFRFHVFYIHMDMQSPPCPSP